MNNIHLINNIKFKGINISFNYTIDIAKEEVSYYAILASIMSKSCYKYINQTEIEKHLFKYSGISFDTNVQKIGDLYNISFNMECLNKKYSNNIDTFCECINFLNEIINNPIFKNVDEYSKIFELEKNSILDRVLSKKDDKMEYAISKTEEILSKNTLFGEYLYGNEEIIKKITKEDIINIYDSFTNNSSLNIFISGNLDGYENIKKYIINVFGKHKDKRNILELKENKEIGENKFEEIFEKCDINQSILTYGLVVEDINKEDFYALMLYNTILGGTAGSKLFQNFREKESLAYTVSSKYYRFKNYIVIYAGIDFKNYKISKIVVENEIRNMTNNISIEEFESAKNNLLANINEWKDSKLAISKIRFFNYIYFKNDEHNIELMYKKIFNLKIEDIYAVAKKIKINKIFLLGGDQNI